MGTATKARRLAGPPQDRLVTGEELLQHPEWGTCELIEGRVKLLSPAGGRHGDVAGFLHLAVARHVYDHDLGRVLAAETGIYIRHDADTVRAPDVAFVSKARIPQEGLPDGYLDFPPDLVVEVVSPNDRFSEVVEKAEQFLGIGIQVVWIVDPRRKTVHVHKKNLPVEVLHEGDTLKEETLLPGFALTLHSVFTDR